MSTEISEEEIFADDKDPLEAIAELRREEGSEVSDDLKEGINEELAESSNGQQEESEQEKDEIEDIQPTKEPDEGTQDNKTEEKSDEGNESSEDLNEKTESEDELDTGIKTFKADGKEFSFTHEEREEQFQSLFGKAMHFTQSMQKIAPYRKMISALEEEGVTQDQLNIALDAMKGDKGAIQQILKDNKIDAFDLDSGEEDNSEYIPTSYGKEESQLAIDDVASRISKDKEYNITVDVVDNQWDPQSRQALSANPAMIEGLHNDIKQGVYDKVAPLAMKMKVHDGNTKSDLEYYMLAGKQFTETQQTSEKTVDDLNSDTQAAEKKFEKASSEATNKRAAASTGSRAGSKGVIDYLDDDNDENYDAWYKKLQASN